MASPDKDRAVVIGSGPNGLAAAILLARAGRAVTVLEAADQAGGGARTAALTLPGFLHDLCSAVHPMGAASPCFEQFPLRDHGLEWVHPEAPLAHPFDDGSAVMLERSLDATCAGLNRDGPAWRSLMEPYVSEWPDFRHDLLRGARLGLPLPRSPLLMARFAARALRPARSLAESAFQSERARALFAGLAAHSMLPLESTPSAAIGLALAVAAHTAGWPFARGGSGRIAAALVGCLRSFGGEVVTGSPVTRLPEAPLVLCDLTPRQLLAIASDRFPAGYRRALGGYRYGPGSFKIDWALGAPIPWRARDCLRAGTVHVGGSLAEIALWESRHEGRPFVLVAQPSLFDSSRAPAGRHTAWGYCHVPNGSAEDMTEAIESQVDRFAPGFRERILARSILPPSALERHNPNLIGGDIGGGANTLRQTVLRPTRSLYRTPLKSVYICSSSTPPGGGVHGMCGYWAAKAALGDC